MSEVKPEEEEDEDTKDESEEEDTDTVQFITDLNDIELLLGKNIKLCRSNFFFGQLVSWS